MNWNFRNTFGKIVVVLLFILFFVAYKMNLNTDDLLKLTAGPLQNVTRRLRKDHQQKSLNLCSGYGRRNVSFQSNDSCIKRMPNCIMIGVEKAGTFALLTFLSAHPQVVRNTSYTEVYFFDRYYDKGLDWYREKMPYSLPGQVVFEKTPSYFIRSEVPARILRTIPDIRLLLIVRNPVKRSISDYVMQKEIHHGVLKDFEKFVLHPSGQFEPASPFIQHSLYDFYLQRWLKYFSMDQIHVIDGDAFSSNPLEELKSIEKFLALDSFFTKDMFVFNTTKQFYCLKTMNPERGNIITDCLKESKGRKHPKFSPLVIKKMKSFFRPHNEHFYNMTGQHFNWNY